MKISLIGAMLETLDYEGKYASDFRFRNRFIGNFLSREIRKANISSDRYNSILVVGRKSAPRETYFFEKFLVVEVLFNQAAYDNAGDNLPNILTEMYLSGLEKARLTHDIPYDYVVSSINNFREAGYKNEWEFKSKTFKNIGVKASLYCKMTTEYFSLTLILTQKHLPVFSEEILHTQPSETMFANELKDVILELGEIKVINRRGATIYSIRWPLENKTSE